MLWALGAGPSLSWVPILADQCFFITFLKKAKFSTQFFFAPFGGDFNEFGSILNYISFEISHFSAPQAKKSVFYVSKTIFLSFSEGFSEKA